MRILFISSYFPEDLSTSIHGVYKRMGMFIDAIKEIAEIDMLFFVDPDNYKPEALKDYEKEFSKHWDTNINLNIYPRSNTNTDNYLSLILSTAAGILSLSNQKGYKEYCGKIQITALEECLERGPDAIFAHRLSAMCPLLLTEKSLPPVFFDMDDIEHVVLNRYIDNRNNLRSNLLKLLIPSLKRGEYNAVRLASKTFVCSEGDRKYLTERFKPAGIVVVPNSINIPVLEPLTKEPNMLFLASDYDPNLQAAEFLIQEIWPEVIKKVPDAKLVIAGISSDRLNTKQGSIPGLELPGFVEDLDALYKKTRLTIVPMLVGGGTRFKIVESAMYARPTVSTSLGAEGIELSDPNEILIQDSPESIAGACVELLKNFELSEKMGLAARKKAKELYDRKNVVNSVKTHILNSLK